MDEAKRLIELIPRLRRYARALVGERSSADDLVQDTLERAWAKLHLYRRGTDLRAWLFTVMHNVHVNRVRATRSTDPLEEEMPELAQRGTQPDGLLESRRPVSGHHSLPDPDSPAAAAAHTAAADNNVVFKSLMATLARMTVTLHVIRVGSGHSQKICYKS